ncbi:hypothetical protein ACRBEV_18870 [Methylobacterium phyllosphaerae]
MPRALRPCRGAQPDRTDPEAAMPHGMPTAATPPPDDARALGRARP